MNIWDILEIAETTDVKKIKKSYARLTKEIHPEEQPKEFQRLHDAYLGALSYAKMLGKENITSTYQLDETSNLDNNNDISEQMLFADFDMNALWEHRKAAVDYLKEIFDSPQWSRSKVWEDYTSSDIFQSVKKDDEFFGYLYHVLQIMQIRDSYVHILYDALEFDTAIAMTENEEKLYKLLKPYCHSLQYNAWLSRLVSTFCLVLTIFAPIISPILILFISALHIFGYWRLVWYPKKHYEEYGMENSDEFGKYVYGVALFFWISLVLQFFILTLYFEAFAIVIGLVFAMTVFSILLYTVVIAIKEIKK